MEYRKASLIPHSHLLRMARLSQRTVDYAIKAYELKSIAACRLAYQAEYEMCNLQLRSGDPGSTFNAVGEFFGERLLPACIALRVYSALDATVTAATEIARNTSLILERGCETESSFSSYKEVGDFINSLVRLYTVALFNREIQHAKTVLHALCVDQWLTSTLDLAHEEITKRAGSAAQFELPIVRCLGQIAEQSCKIADLITLWLEGRDCLITARWVA